SMEKLREIAMRMQRGGVGYYPNANTPFVHIDVGGVRHWPRMSYDQLVRLFPDGKTVHLPSNGHPLAGYEEARAEILARGGEAISVADANRGGIGGFFARLFGLNGGEDAEEEIRDAAPVAKPTRVARASIAEQRRNEAAAAAAAAAAEAEQRRMLASAETNLPRGETYLAAPEPATRQPAAAPQPQPAPLPTMAEPAARPAPAARPEPAPVPPPAPVAESEKPRVEDEAKTDAPPADVPLPPRRPAQLAALEPPLPPQRPAELASLPEVITHGSRLDPRPPASAPLTLAYAAPSPDLAPPPLPPPRPAAAPLRAAALGKAEEARAARTAASQMAPARVDRAALHSMVAATPQSQARPSVSGGLAPALRAAAKPDLLAASPPPRNLRAQFGRQPTQPDPDAFSK
ncbi:DUF882 domain-containing protein, partial [uncultured Rhodoblastus sp.]|uniref:DUF882 domain-containing protein n=1 Tax=uncultured Rhodoblastus sp. TaxID=543037 RepID=UPI0025F9EC64